MSNEPWDRPTNVRWRIVGLLLAFSFMSWFNRTSISVAYVGQIKSEFGISEEAMGAVISAFLIAYMLCMTPGGWLADRFGPWAALVVMGIGSGLFGILTGCVGFLVQPAGGIDFSLLATLTGCVSFLAQSSALLFLFLIVRTIMGAFTAPIYPASTRIVSYWIPFHQRAMVNGMIMAAALVGIASTFHVFGTLVDSFRWPMAFAITGTFTTVLAVLWAWYAKDHPEQHRHVNPAEEIWIRRNKVSFVEAGFTTKYPPESEFSRDAGFLSGATAA